MQRGDTDERQCCGDTQGRAATCSRRGAVLVLAAVVLVAIFGFAALTIDVGFIALTKAQLQNATDAAALAATAELEVGIWDAANWDDADQKARQVAENLAFEHPNGSLASTVIDPNIDVRFGRIEWDPASNSWQTIWDVPPYNLTEVTAIRSTGRGNELPLFMAPVLGIRSADVTASAVAAIFPSAGFRIEESNETSRVPILPFTVSVERWEHALRGGGDDDYGYDADRERVYHDEDGIAELNIYPGADDELESGNSGTVNFGAPNNGVGDLARQILEGLNADDLSYFGGELSTENGPIYATGDPGLSLGFKDELHDIRGQVRAIPLYDEVKGSGANSTYRIVKFVGGRIMSVKMSGGKSQKRLIVQPTPFATSTAVRSKIVPDQDTIYTVPALVR